MQGFSKIWDLGFFWFILARLTLCLFSPSEGFSASCFLFLSRATLIISCEYLRREVADDYGDAHVSLFLFLFSRKSLDHRAILAEKKVNKNKRDVPTEPAATSCSLAAGLKPPCFLCSNHCAARCAVLYTFYQQRAWKQHAGCHPYVALSQKVQGGWRFAPLPSFLHGSGCQLCSSNASHSSAEARNAYLLFLPFPLTKSFVACASVSAGCWSSRGSASLSDEGSESPNVVVLFRSWPPTAALDMAFAMCRWTDGRA